MTVPERNLPPDALPWGRSVDKRIEELTKRISVAAATAKAAAARSASAARNTAYVAERADQLEQSQTAIVDEVVNKNESEWVPLEPANPQHGHHWYDVADGNVLKIYADYGDYERINYVTNPTFYEGTEGWTALSGELAITAEGKGHISAPVDGAAAIVETEGRAVVIDIPADEDGGEGEAGQVGALWTASAEVELVGSSVTVTATLEVIGPDDEPVSSSGPVVIEYGTPVRITARPLPGVEGTMDEVRVALSLVNTTEPEFEVTVDEVILEAAEYGEGEEQQFFDGSMPGVLWQGTPHRSTSWWDGMPRWIEAQDEKLKNEVFATTDEIREDLDQAVADLAATQEWVDETGQELVQRVGSAEGAISTVENVLEDVRSNVGRKQWVWAPGAGPQVLVVHDPEPTTTEFVRAEPLGDGKVKFTALIPGVHTDWQVGAATGLADGDTYTHTFTETGTLWVRVRTDGVLHQAPFTVEPAVLGPADGLGSWEDMEWPDIDWSDAEIGLGQLRDAGLLDPDVWSRLFQDVVVGGVVAATEAFIGSNAIIDNAVQARHVVASESLWAKLATFARVTTDMLLVGGSNLLPDPRFEDAELTAGRMSRSAATAVSGGYQTTQYFYFCPGTAAADVRRYAVPVTAGDTYRIEIPVTLTSALSSTPRLETWNTSATGRTLRTVTDWTYQDGILSYTYKVPEGVAYLSPIIYRTTSYTVHPGARVTLMADSRLLVDGAVTARALNVVHELPSGDLLRIDPDGIRVWRGGNYGSYPNIALTAGDGFKIAKDDGTPLLWIDPATGDLRTDGAVLSNSELTAPTITGGTFRTGVTGRRQQIDTANGFRAWNSANQQTAQIDGQDNWLAGTFRTNRPGQPGMIAGTSTEGYPIMLWSESGEGYWSDAYITAGFDWDDEQQWDLLFSARSGSYLRFDGGLTGMPEGQFYSLGPWSISKTGQGMFRSLSTTGLNAADGAIDTNSIGLTAHSDNRIIFEGDGILRASGIRSNSNPNAPNVFINSSGRLYHATSSRRFKDDIQPVPEDFPDRLLQIEPVTFLDKMNLQRHEEVQRKEKAGEEVAPEEYEVLEPIRRIPGLIAEDVEAAGLVEYVMYDDDGTVSGYTDRLWTLLIPLVRNQREKINELEQRITALEGEN